MQEENEIAKKQMEELKSVNENLLADKNAMDIKLNSKTISMQKMTQ